MGIFTDMYDMAIAEILLLKRPLHHIVSCSRSCMRNQGECIVSCVSPNKNVYQLKWLLPSKGNIIWSNSTLRLYWPYKGCCPIRKKCASIHPYTTKAMREMGKGDRSFWLTFWFTFDMPDERQFVSRQVLKSLSLVNDVLRILLEFRKNSLRNTLKRLKLSMGFNLKSSFKFSVYS